MRSLTAIPVFNEQRHLDAVLREAIAYSPNLLVVDDGSTDGTPDLLRRWDRVRVLTHDRNRGYGAALRSAFSFAVENRYDVLVTLDCDGQHEPQRIPQLVAAADRADIVSGSRYLEPAPGGTQPPEDRRRINVQITDELNRTLGLRLTDAFCGFKAYRTAALAKFDITEPGYAMPLQVWVQVVHFGMTIVEVPVPLIYLEEHRAFGGALDDAARRLAYYRRVLQAELERWGIREQRS